MSAKLVCIECQEHFEAKRSDALRCKACHRQHRKQYLQNYERGKRRGHCMDCGTEIGARAQRCRGCDNKARVGKYVGHSNPNWREGRTTTNDGYIALRIKTGTPGKGKGAFYQLEHRLVWERVHGKSLPKGWVVHHLNGIKDDNRPQNLLGLPRWEHHRNPRDVLRHYERRILQLEQELREVQQLRMPTD